MIFPSRDAIAAEIQTLIYQRGGRTYEMSPSEVYDQIAERFHLDKVARKLTRDEYYDDQNQSSAWANLVQWARQNLIDDGSLDRHAPRGIWRLTPKGIEQARVLLGVRRMGPLKQLIELGKKK